ncbi:MAG: hypothetical protein WB580_10990 [Candidatus Binataceae bacterium]
MPDLSDPAVHKLTAEILARPEYGQATGGDSILVRLLSWLLDKLGQLEILRVKEPVIYWTILAVVALVLAGMTVHLIWTLWVALSAPEPAAQRWEGSSRRDLAQEADALAADGRYLEAAHRLMLASFRALAERSVIELRPDRPNRWIRTALLRSSLAEGLALEIGALIEQTERLWFGDRRNDPGIYARWRSTFEWLCAQAT